MVILALVVVAVIGAGMVAHAVRASVAGGVTAPAFDPRDPDVRAARRAAWSRGGEALDQADQRSALLHPIGRRTRLTDCVRGQANWQTVDDQAVICTATVAQAYAFGGPDAPTAIRQVLADLEGGGCAPAGSSTAAIGASIYLQAPGRPYRNFPNGLQVDDIAGGDGRCGPALPGTEVRLLVRRWETLGGDAGSASDRWAVVLVASEQYWTVDWD